MLNSLSQWQIIPTLEVPNWFVEAVKSFTPESQGDYAAQLLWHRGIQEQQKLAGFLNPNLYKPTSPFDFGQEMKMAVQRLWQGRERGEKIVIWGDFDADGITSTSVLWEGLGQFVPQQNLSYYIPNRLTESHGLNKSGIDSLAKKGTQLIVTCDTGSTNLKEIDYAQELGIDIIITDHHTLPPERPPVVAIINPRNFAEHHPLFHLSGVAVAYKLIEALYLTMPEVPQQPLENLLDLVAIGLIADLVQLSGDCRYLAQKGISQLQKQTGKNATRPGVAYLLKLCKKTGDRPTDISFGLGPRINAVSRIQGEASFCVELLTNRDAKYCEKLALETELANTRRKEIQKNVTENVKRKLAQMDLSTTRVIVLEDSQWEVGVLGLVAGQIAQEYGRPTVLLTTTEVEEEAPVAKGSARSVGGIDLYELIYSQAHLLNRFGGHPFAAGLSLPVENLALFKEAINQKLRQESGDANNLSQVIQVDLTVTVAELGKELFRELKLLEPCGMGNPVPKLLIKNCWFEQVWNRNQQDYRGKKVQYIKTTFEIWDSSCKQEGFPGIWWGHYKEDIPGNKEPCDVVVELDFNTYESRYEVRIIDLKPHSKEDNKAAKMLGENFLIDMRSLELKKTEIANFPVAIEECPGSWEEINTPCQKAIAHNQKVALAYAPSSEISAPQTWKKLVGLAKYLNRTGKIATSAQLQEKLNINRQTLQLGLEALTSSGFQVNQQGNSWQISWQEKVNHNPQEKLLAFCTAVEEEQFRRSFFYKVPISTLQNTIY
ncbi:MAG: single-stranded-DNA-specific exonuclease RecJ [Spirulinaceae cyanobacterium]